MIREFRLYPREEHFCSFADYGAILDTVRRLDAKRVLEFGPGHSTLALVEGGAVLSVVVDAVDELPVLEIGEDRGRWILPAFMSGLRTLQPRREVTSEDWFDLTLRLGRLEISSESLSSSSWVGGDEHAAGPRPVPELVAHEVALDEDLAEALALAHDLGHPPFGHAGEDVLHECTKDHGGFSHNRQALRIVEDIEQRYPDFPGLNLSLEVLAGQQTRTDKARASLRPPLEAQVVDAADHRAETDAVASDAGGDGVHAHRARRALVRCGRVPGL